MWTPSRSLSKLITIRRTVWDKSSVDKYNRPKKTTKDELILGEVIPLSSEIKRQAIGITNEEAYKINLPNGTEINSDDVILIGEKEFCAVSKSQFLFSKSLPVQIVVTKKAESEAEHER